MARVNFERPVCGGLAFDACSALNFYQLILSVAGVLLFGWLMAILPGAIPFWVVGGVMTAVAALGIVEVFVVYKVGSFSVSSLRDPPSRE